MQINSFVDSFFYRSYTYLWPGATLQDMKPVYLGEIRSLFRCLRQSETYHQELFCDVPLKNRLYQIENGIPVRVVLPKNDKSISFRKNEVVFFDSNQQYSCSYTHFCMILRHYFELLISIFPDMETLDLMQQLEQFHQKHTGLSKLKRWLPTPIQHPFQYTPVDSKKIHLKPGEIFSFRQLNCADTLVSLTAAGRKIRNPEALAHYSKLTTLVLSEMELTDLSFLSQLTNLKELILRNNRIVDLSPLKNLKNLESLYLVNNPVRDLSVLHTLPKLHTLRIGSQQIQDYSELDSFPPKMKIQVIELTPTVNQDRFDANILYTRLPQKKPVANRRSKSLNIKDRWLFSAAANSLGYFPTVPYDMSKLKQLDCSNRCKTVEDWTFLTEDGDFSALQYAVNLKTLDLSGRILNDFMVLKSCSKLTKLNLSNTNLTDLSILQFFPNLTHLTLKNLPPVTSSESILLLAKLQCLYINQPVFSEKILSQLPESCQVYNTANYYV